MTTAIHSIGPTRYRSGELGRRALIAAYTSISRRQTPARATARGAPCGSGGTGAPSRNIAIATIGRRSPPSSSRDPATSRVLRRRRYQAAAKTDSGIAASATGRTPSWTSPNAKITKPAVPAKSSTTPR